MKSRPIGGEDEGAGLLSLIRKKVFFGERKRRKGQQPYERTFLAVFKRLPNSPDIADNYHVGKARVAYLGNYALPGRRTHQQTPVATS